MTAGLIVLAYLIFCAALVAEKRSLLAARRSLTHVIHVGGIRGKTSVCRLLDGVLRQQYSVVTKTTGTAPMVIDRHGLDRPFRRLGAANILEQRRLLWRARREGAEILVAECMAVQPELQTVSQRQLLRGDIAVITNVRRDHMFELGETLEEVAENLCGIIPENGTLFTADRTFFPLFEERCRALGSEAVLCLPQEGEDENTAIVRAIALHLGLSRAAVDAGLGQVQQDFGVSRLYPLKNKEGADIQFLNLFSVNDPQSTLSQLARYLDGNRQVYFLYNHRSDRPDRLLLFARYFFPQTRCDGVFLMGPGLPLARRHIGRSVSCPVTAVKGWEACLDIPAGAVLVGIGNIKGVAYQMVETLERGNRT